MVVDLVLLESGLSQGRRQLDLHRLHSRRVLAHHVLDGGLPVFGVWGLVLLRRRLFWLRLLARLVGEPNRLLLLLGVLLQLEAEGLLVAADEVAPSVEELSLVLGAARTLDMGESLLGRRGHQGLGALHRGQLVAAWAAHHLRRLLEVGRRPASTRHKRSRHLRHIWSDVELFHYLRLGLIADDLDVLVHCQLQDVCRQWLLVLLGLVFGEELVDVEQLDDVLVRRVPVAANTTELEVVVEDGFAESALGLAIADDESLEGLQRGERTEDAAVGPGPALIEVPMPRNSINRLGGIRPSAGRDATRPDINRVILASLVELLRPLERWHRSLLLQVGNRVLVGLLALVGLHESHGYRLLLLGQFYELLLRVAVQLEALEPFDLRFEVLDDPFGLLASLVLQLKQFLRELLVFLINLYLLASRRRSDLGICPVGWLRILCLRRCLLLLLAHLVVEASAGRIRVLVDRGRGRLGLVRVLVVSMGFFRLLDLLVGLGSRPEYHASILSSQNLHALHLHQGQTPIAVARVRLRGVDWSRHAALVPTTLTASRHLLTNSLAIFDIEIHLCLK